MNEREATPELSEHQGFKRGWKAAAWGMSALARSPIRAIGLGLAMAILWMLSMLGMMALGLIGAWLGAALWAEMTARLASGIQQEGHQKLPGWSGWARREPGAGRRRLGRALGLGAALMGATALQALGLSLLLSQSAGSEGGVATAWRMGLGALNGLLLWGWLMMGAAPAQAGLKEAMRFGGRLALDLRAALGFGVFHMMLAMLIGASGALLARALLPPEAMGASLWWALMALAAQAMGAQAGIAALAAAIGQKDREAISPKEPAIEESAR